MRRIASAWTPLRFIVACGITLMLAMSLQAQTPFLRGDCNDDGQQNLVDDIFLLSYLFSGGSIPSCFLACDSNDDDSVNLVDAVYHLSYLFSQGAPPAFPFPSCGLDPTPGTVTCLASVQCASGTPSFQSTAPSAASVGVVYFYQVVAVDPDGTAITYTLEMGPTSASVDPSSGILTWLPNSTEVAEIDFVVRATDGSGEYADQIFSVSSGYRINCGEALVPYDDGTRIWTTDLGFDAGSSAVFSTASAIDGTDADPIYQRLRYANGPATLYEIPIAPGEYEVRLHFAETFYTAEGLRRFGVDIEGCRALTEYDIWSASGGDHIAIVEEFAVAVLDGSVTIDLLSTGPDLAVLNAIEIVATALTQSPPAIVSIPSTITAVSTAYDYQVEVADPDLCDTHAFALLQAPTGATISPTGLLTWSPGPTDVGAHMVQVEVEDSSGLTTAQLWQLTVSGIPQAPVFNQTPAPPSVATVGLTYTYSAMATDPGDTIVYSLDTPHPPSATIDPMTGALSWVPTGTNVGMHTLVVRATDSTGLSDTLSFPVDVAYRLNCGSSTGFLGTNGEGWAADSGHNGGFVYVAPGMPTIACSNGDDLLLQSIRVAPASGFLNYALELPPIVGCYRVKLYFSELDPAAGVGTRVFNIALEGVTLDPNFDILAQTLVDCPSAVNGLFGTVVREHLVTVNDNQLNISLASLTSDAVLAAIEVTSGCTP